jgi:uncharacterized protein (DUF362 family)
MGVKIAGMKFHEKIDGYFGIHISDFRDGEDYGMRYNETIHISVTIEVDPQERFLDISNHKAKLRGCITVEALAGKTEMLIKNGVFHVTNGNMNTGHHTLSYHFNFETPEGQLYYFSGFNDIVCDKEQADTVEDLTTLFVRIYKGKDDSGELAGSGIMYFRLKNVSSFIKAMKLSHHDDKLHEISAVSRFISFFTGVFSQFISFFMRIISRFTAFFKRKARIYRLGPEFIYYTRYKNLVLSGQVQDRTDSERKQFFLFSGIFEKDFPWGDGESMSDVALLITHKNGNSLRYGINARSLESLTIDIEGNTFVYKGELLKITEGDSLSFFDIHSGKNKIHLETVKIEVKLTLETLKYKKVGLAFKAIEKFERLIPDNIKDTISQLIPNIGILGLFISPYKVTVTEGTITILDGSDENAFRIIPEKTLGEAETGELRNLREPTINFHYLCGINTDSKETYLDIRTGVLRNEREKYGKDLIDKMLGRVYETKIRKNVILKESVEESTKELTPLEDMFTLIGDHFPTALLERKMVRVKNGKGETFYALACCVNPINPLPINSDKSTSVVVLTYEDTSDYDGKVPTEEKVMRTYNNPEKFKVLDKVIEESKFFDMLERKYHESEKSRSDFSIIIKPNFMFMYSIDDRTTFTDPALVEHLVTRLIEKGFSNIKIGEARSTLSVFYDKRDVKSVALRIGFKENNGYKIVDMSDNLVTEHFGGTLGVYKVNKDWKDADFRISFAKNKTHSYTYYTLTLKNIYGALADEYKFKVFHHEFGDIYKPTIDYIKKFPIHFGFIDAVISADGPFGIFADPYPQLTMTIIGGEDIVAVDWVGSGKMGINPMLSRYMQEAVKEFGKPEIKIIGDKNLYKFWTNVPRISDIGAHTMDKHYIFGYAIYYILSHMEPYFPVKPSEYKLITTLKKYSGPFNEWVYKQPNKPPSFIHKVLNQVIFRMWQ